MKTNVRFSALLLLLLGQPAFAGDDAIPGIKVGAKAPAATFVDQTGKTVTLNDLTKNGPVALVFHRSARW